MGRAPPGTRNPRRPRGRDPTPRATIRLTRAGMAGRATTTYSHRAHALPARRSRTRDTAAGDRRGLVLHDLVQGSVRHATLADPRIRLPSDDAALVHRGAAVVRWRVDAVADRRTRVRPDD